MVEAVAVATAVFVENTETAVSAPAGAPRSAIRTVCTDPACTMTAPAAGGFEIARPAGEPNGVSVWPDCGALTATIAAATPCVEVPRTAVAPVATPAIVASTFV